MTNEKEKVFPHEDTSSDESVLQGVYGKYRITKDDEIEVQRYRISILICGISFCGGIFHWLLLGPALAWLWLIPITISIGLALKWIHIYLRPLHRALQILWAMGCLGLGLLLINFGGHNLLSSLSSKPISTLAIGPLFAALTGIGFKEFFCFRRLEAIGLTILIPLALLGHLIGILQSDFVMALLICSAILLLVLAIRKFGMDAAADVGDKSVFDYLDRQETAEAL